MDEKFDTYLKSIENLVYIDDKIVTYKLVTKTLNVPVTTCRRFLLYFIKKHSDLQIVYLISGIKDDGLCFQLVHGKDFESVKSSFTKIISEQVFSIQKMGSVNECDLYNACNEAGKVNQSAVNKNNFERREIRIIPKPEVKKPVENATSKGSKAEPPKSKEIPEDTENSVQSKTLAKKPAGKKVQPSKGAGIGAFFNKQNSMPSKAVKSVKTKENNEDKPVESKPKEKEVEEKVEKVKKSEPKKRKKNQKETKNKKRKRIMLASDSESSEEEMEVEEERELSPEPEQPPLPDSDDEIIPPTPVQKGRKRITKQVDRTYTDEEGFIITKKECVVESCSDEESNETSGTTEPQKEEKMENKKLEISKENVNTKNVSPDDKTKGSKKRKGSPVKDGIKKVKNEKKTKKLSPVKGKQKTMLNFFQRK